MLPVVALLLAVAVSADTGDVDCTLKPETGLCQAYFPSYFFNATSGQCEQFVYGGCQGNSNRFHNKRECEVACKPRDAIDCNADPEVGMCLALIPRFFYDRKTKECKDFSYGGCGGNTNNFNTYEECRDACGAVPPRTEPDCSSPAETGLCRAYFPRYFFNTESGRCERFIYGGCGGNDNSYDSVEHCQNSCGGIKEDEVDCEAEAESGLCKAYMPMYHYDSATKTCSQFIYGGCGGNTNRFSTWEHCMQKCHVEEEQEYAEEEEVDCDAEPETGFCRANFPMFYYNRAKGSCEEFVYGGCGGNGNRFGSEEDCMNRCHVKESQKDCESAPETGFCRGFMPRFYYDQTTGTCEHFIYGGCGGNANRFETQDECLSTCQ